MYLTNSISAFPYPYSPLPKNTYRNPSAMLQFAKSTQQVKHSKTSERHLVSRTSEYTRLYIDGVTDVDFKAYAPLVILILLQLLSKSEFFKQQNLFARYETIVVSSPSEVYAEIKRLRRVYQQAQSSLC